MELRPYQKESIANIRRDWESYRSTLLVLPTGCGKTIVFCKLAELVVSLGWRVLILAHREELLLQAADKMMQATGLQCAVEKAEQTADGTFYRITVGSVQTLMNPKRLARFSPDFYDAIIIDEAHHALSPSYQKVIEHFSGAKILGVTATPDRGDKKNLGAVFESLAFEYTLPEAIRSGYLSPIKALTVPLDIDLTKVKSQAGDYKLGDLDDALDPYLEQIADEMVKHCLDKKTIVFLPLIATSKKMQAFLNSRGFRAGEVNGESKDRKQVLADFHEGKYNVLCNSMLLTEGYDEPAVDCIVCLRPTKVRALYSQIVGRGTRLFPGKESLLVLDFLWHTDKHELCRPANLIASSPAVAKKMTEIAEEKSKGAVQLELDLEDLEELAKGEVVTEREAALAKTLAEMKKKKSKLVDPVQFALSINSADLAGYEPSLPSEMGPPTKKQVDMLEKMGVFSGDIQNSGHASKIIDRLKTRQSMGFTTPKQIRFLEGRGFNHVGEWKASEASSMVARISANRWHIPRGVVPSEFKPASLLTDAQKAMEF